MVRLEQADWRVRRRAEPSVHPGGCLTDARTFFAIRWQAVAAWLRDLDEGESPAERRVVFEQALDGEQFLVNAFRVVHPIDAEADTGAVRKIEIVQDAGAADRRRRRCPQRPSVGVDADRVNPDPRCMAAIMNSPVRIDVGT